MHSKKGEIKEMRNIFYLSLTIIMFPFYGTAYAISNILNLNGVEDMPTISEWFNLYKEAI